MLHYGIPTEYIDFTTDAGVAGFFAVDTTNLPNEGKSCIFCLNMDDLMSVWDIVKDIGSRKEAKANIELVRIDVLNLWRLQVAFLPGLVKQKRIV
jgi:FRG domain